MWSPFAFEAHCIVRYDVGIVEIQLDWSQRFISWIHCELFVRAGWAITLLKTLGRVNRRMLYKMAVHGHKVVRFDLVDIPC